MDNLQHYPPMTNVGRLTYGQMDLVSRPWRQEGCLEVPSPGPEVRVPPLTADKIHGAAADYPVHAGPTNRQPT